MAQIATFYDHIREISRQEECSVVDAMVRARELGVSLLEVSQNNILGREDEVGQELAYADMGISSIPAYFNFGRDPDVKKQAMPVLEAAKYLGADKLLVIPGFFNEEDTPAQREDQRKAIAQGINTLAELAAPYGLSLVMEDFDSPLAPFATIDGVKGFLDDCPMLSCCFDTGNFIFSGDDELEAYHALKDRIGHVHLKDRAFTSLHGEQPKVATDGRELFPCPVGAGEIQIPRIIDLLRQDGYAGAYTIEHYDSATMLENLEKSVKWLAPLIG